MIILPVIKGSNTVWDFSQAQQFTLYNSNVHIVIPQINK